MGHAVPAHRRRSLVEQLETRVMMSASPNDTIGIEWEGRSTTAFRGQYIVEAASTAVAGALAGIEGVTSVQSLGGNYFKLNAVDSVEAVGVSLAALGSAVVDWSPNFIIKPQAVPNDAEYAGYMWHLKNTGQTIAEPIHDPTGFASFYSGSAPGTVGEDIDAELAWDITTGDRSVIIAVLDTGIDVNHPDLINNLWINPGEVASDGIDNDGNGYIDDVNGYNVFDNNGDITDLDGHGTHVAGTIGAEGNNSIGVTGVAQQVTLIPVKVFNSEGSDSATIISGMHYIVNLKNSGVDITAVNASLGGQDFQYDNITSGVVKRMADAGLLLIVSAGNDTQDVNSGTAFPAKFSLDHPNVITVAATGNQGELASFSNYGQTAVTVAAPGNNILSTLPTYRVTANEDSPFDFDTLDDHPLNYAYFSGTSMASPVVTGIAALLKAAKPSASMLEIKEAIINSVEKLPSLDRPNSLPRFVETGGRVNAYLALKNILNSEVKTDVATQGNWLGHYGSQGYILPGQGNTLGATAVVTGAVEKTVRPGNKAQALVAADGSGVKVGSYLTTTTYMDVQYTPADTTTRRVSLYFAELSGSKRTQTIELFDPATGNLLNSEVISGFAKGTYVTYEVSGPVMFRIVKNTGRDAVLNGFFVDAAPTSTQTLNFHGEDRTTGGNWKTAYDADGAYLIGYTDKLSGTATVTATNADPFTLASSTTRKGSLLFEGQTRKGVAAWVGSTTTGEIGLDFADDAKHQITVYAADLNKKKRVQRFEVLDSTGNVIDSREVSNFAGGVYLTWEVAGDVTIRFTKIAGPDAIVNAVFVDEPANTTGHYVGRNTTTNGKWGRVFGNDSAYIVGDRDATVVPNREFIFPQTGGTLNVISESSRLPGAVERYVMGSSMKRLAAQLESRDTITVTLDLTASGNLSGSQTQRVSFYAADFQKKNYSQRIEILNANGELIAHTDMVAFNNGQYATFDLSGVVTVKIINLSDNSDRAVLSAIYFD